MEQIKSIISGVIKDIETKQQTKDDIDKIWRGCIEKKAAKHTKVVFSKKDKIYINVDNTSWLYELKLRRKQILEKIKKTSNNKIKNVIFRVGEVNDNSE